MTNPNKETLASVEHQLEMGRPKKRIHEHLREKWSLQTYALNEALLLPVEIAQIAGAPVSVQESMVEDIDAFLSKLGMGDYLENLSFDFKPDIRHTTFEVILSIAQPDDGFKKSVRRWFTYTVPHINADDVSLITSLLIQTFSDRDCFQTPPERDDWKVGRQIDTRTHVPSDLIDLKEDMTDVIQTGGRVSLQRFMISLKTKHRKTNFFARHGEFINYSTPVTGGF